MGLGDVSDGTTEGTVDVVVLMFLGERWPCLGRARGADCCPGNAGDLLRRANLSWVCEVGRYAKFSLPAIRQMRRLAWMTCSPLLNVRVR